MTHIYNLIKIMLCMLILIPTYVIIQLVSIIKFIYGKFLIYQLNSNNLHVIFSIKVNIFSIIPCWRDCNILIELKKLKTK